jgi:hypothetical protein
MARVRKEEVSAEPNNTTDTKETLTINDIGWTDHVLSHLSDDEKISGNPTTDGLRRIFEKVMNCKLVQSTTSVVQSPSPENEKRATVIHRLVYRLNGWSQDTDGINTVTVDGSADVYWGNCDKVYRNHPVAVAETRAEGRALRRALKLRKVVAAEELAENIEDDISNDSVNRISSNQLNFLDVMAKRLNINVVALANKLSLDGKNIKKLLHDDGVKLIRELSRYQQDIDSIPEDIKPYESNWN